MAKVINQVKTETFGKLELIIKGECENCGLWLEWKDYGYAEDE